MQFFSTRVYVRARAFDAKRMRTVFFWLDSLLGFIEHALNEGDEKIKSEFRKKTHTTFLRQEKNRGII